MRITNILKLLDIKGKTRGCKYKEIW